MRILCIGTSEDGGAGVAMRRLVDALRSEKASVDILSLRRGTARNPDFSEALPRFQAGKQLHKHLGRGLRKSRTALTNTIFTFDWPAWDLASHPAVVEADVINLHWITGFLNPAMIRRLIDTGKPIVWTLHDQRAFTGGCHYTAGCEQFTSACKRCPQLTTPARPIASRLLQEARQHFRGAKLTFVTPSRWLGQELLRSSLFDASYHQHHVIPYGIDLTRFYPQQRKAELRSRLSLPPDGLGIVFGSVSLTEGRKGFAYARMAMESLARRLRTSGHSAPQPFVITFGHGEPTLDGIRCYHLGPQTEAGVISILNAADVFFTMTREDNLPNTVMEAIACGVPVLATRVGGVPDMIDHGQQGWLVARDDSTAAADILLDLVTRPDQLQAYAIAARQRAHDAFAATFQSRRYLALFEGLLSAKAANTPSVCAGAVPLPMARLTPAMLALATTRMRYRGARRIFRRMLTRLR